MARTPSGFEAGYLEPRASPGSSEHLCRGQEIQKNSPGIIFLSATEHGP